MSETTLPAVQTEKRIGDMLHMPKVRDALEDALGGSMPVDFFISQMNIAFNRPPAKPGQPKLSDCTTHSKYECANICATLGLLPTLGQVALIPRAGVCTVMPQWQGFQTLMMRCDEIKSVKAVLIHSMDFYVYNAETEQLVHTHDPFAAGRIFADWNDMKGGYLVVTYKDGRPKLYHCVSMETLKKARACAQTDNIWKAWFQEQCLKTVYRNAFARRVIPMDLNGNNRMERLVEATDKAEGNDPERIAVEDAPVKPISRVEQVKQHRQSAPEKTSEKHDEPTISEYMETDNTVPVERIDVLRKKVREVWKDSTADERLAMYKAWGIDDPSADEGFDLFAIENIEAAIKEMEGPV